MKTMLKSLMWLFAWLSLHCFLLRSAGADESMRAHFIDVGQANASLLEFPCGAILIDCGSQDPDSVDYLAHYLEEFFRRRSDLHNTLDAVFITHPHIDHTRGIREITRVCRILTLVDGGTVAGSGGHDLQWIRDQIDSGMINCRLRPVKDNEIVALSTKRGLTDHQIDPLNCQDSDPKIRILSGDPTRNPGWSQQDFKNWNNHSLVIRVDFGAFSMLFTGDLQESGISLLVDYYRSTALLDVDLYHVGHHGSHNGTTSDLLAAMTPDIAIIGVGQWTYGQNGEDGGFNTFTYGHPRRNIVEMLASTISGDRSQAVTVKVFDGQYSASDYVLHRRIYATGWDGDIMIRADLDGSARVEHVESTWHPPVSVNPLAIAQRRRPTPFHGEYRIDMPAYDSVDMSEPGPTIAITSTPPPSCACYRTTFGCRRWFSWRHCRVHCGRRCR